MCNRPLSNVSISFCIGTSLPRTGDGACAQDVQVPRQRGQPGRCGVSLRRRQPAALRNVHGPAARHQGQLLMNESARFCVKLVLCGVLLRRQQPAGERNVHGPPARCQGQFRHSALAINKQEDCSGSSTQSAHHQRQLNWLLLHLAVAKASCTRMAVHRRAGPNARPCQCPAPQPTLPQCVQLRAWSSSGAKGVHCFLTHLGITTTRLTAAYVHKGFDNLVSRRCGAPTAWRGCTASLRAPGACSRAA